MHSLSRRLVPVLLSLLIIAVFSLVGCIEGVTPFDRTSVLDPGSDTYQGYPTVDDPSDYTVVKPALEAEYTYFPSFLTADVIGGESYRFRIGTDYNANTNAVLNLVLDASAQTSSLSADDTAYPSATELAAGTYYYQAAVVMPGSQPQWTDANQRFSLLSILSDSAVTPADGGQITGSDIAVSWPAVTDAAAYEIQTADSQSDLSSATAQSTTTTGYTFTAPILYGQTKYWRIRAVNAQNEVSVWSSPFSFTVSNVRTTAFGFEEGTFPEEFENETDGWEITDGKAYSGQYSLTSENIGPSDAARTYYTYTAETDGQMTVSFYWSVSSESCCDKFRFYVNGSSYLNEGGEIDWTEYTTSLGEVGAGDQFTFQFEYDKDGSVDRGDDRAWIDDLEITIVGEAPPVNGAPVASVAAGWEHTLIVTESGALWAVGNNGSGQLGDDSSSTRYDPVEILESGVASATGGRYHSAIVGTDGSLWTFGDNGYGQLGDNTYTDRDVPVQIQSSGVAQVAAGTYHTMFRKTDGSLWAMGDNDYGKLGDGTSSYRNYPVQIESSGVIDVAAGDDHTVYVKSDGSMWAMGYNSYGQFGDGGSSSSTTPVQVYASGVADVEAGYRHTLILMTDGSLWATGYNNYGQLGDGSDSTRYTPVEVFSSGVSQIAAGYYHSMIVTDSGGLWATGNNGNGELGDGTGSTRYTPVSIYTSGAVSVAAGYGHTLIERTDGRFYATGDNGYGQLGDGTTSDSYTPVEVY